MKALSHRRMSVAVFAALITAALLASPESNAASLPGTPHVTVGADIKQLTFDWDDAVGAGYYRLLYKVGSGAYKPLIDNIPASTTRVKLSVAVHLQSWSLIRYAVAACNTSGCTNSAAIFPQNLMLDTIGYFKASNVVPDDTSYAGDQFAQAIAFSDDGRTLAVAAPMESSNAAGVNGNQDDNSSRFSGAVYVFHRVTAGWRQEAYVKAGVNQPGQYFGYIPLSNASQFYSSTALAINANGSLLAIGAPGQNVAGIQEAGVVYVYQKSSSGSWRLTATIKAPTPSQHDRFGFSVDMSLDGSTLKVDGFAPWEAPDLNAEGRSHIYLRSGTTWQHSVTLAGAIAGDQCKRTKLSSDGNTLVSTCDNSFTVRHIETFKRSGNTWTNVSTQPLSTDATNVGLAVDFDASTMALQEKDMPLGGAIVGIYKWTGASWVRETGIAPPPTAGNFPGEFGSALALNRNGNLVAIGDRSLAELGAGVSPISMPGYLSSGAVWIWKRDDRTATWALRSVVKSPNPGGGDHFGNSLAFCGNGHALAVGAAGEDGAAEGVDGNREDNGKTDAGAAYLY